MPQPKGKPLSKERRAQISSGLLRYYATHSPPYPGQSPEACAKRVASRKEHDNYRWSEEAKQKLSNSLKGRIFTNEHKHNISKARKGKKLSPEHIRSMSERKEHKLAITQQCEKLESQGFRVVPLDGEYRVVPDIIAIKDNKIYAIEVERGTPNYKKYHGISFYDDIIWVLVKKESK